MLFIRCLQAPGITVIPLMLWNNGPIRKAYVLYLDIADEAGGIATIATILCHGQDQH